MKNEILNILSYIRPEVDYLNKTNYIDECLLDSLDIIRLVSEIEKKYNISINGEDIIPENFQSINNIENLINKTGDLP